MRLISDIKISIVIPSYNQGRYIEQTITSLLDQKYPNLELIIIDGGSKDETVDVIRKYEKDISYWVSEPDRGQSHAINKGLEHVTGDVFNWINSDDYMEPGSLSHIGNYFASNPNKNILCGFTRCFFDKDNSTSHEYRMGVRDTAADTVWNVEMNQPGTFYRTSIVKSFGGVNESLRYVFDDELWFRYLCKYGNEDIGFTDKRLAEFRLHGDSKSVGEGFELFQKEIRALYLDIAKKCNAPAWLVKPISEEPISSKYESSGQWDISHLNSKRFLALIAAKYVNSIYMTGSARQTKEAMKMIIDNGLFKWNRMMVSLRVKSMFA